MRSTQYLAAVAALIAPTFAQTFTSCNPTEKTCPEDKALGKSIAYDFSKGAPSDFTAAAGKQPVFKSDGAHFTISKDGEAPTFSSNFFIMFGHYKVVMKAAPGQGIVSSLVLQSSDLDEVDWEWVGSETGKVQTNYYGKGNTTVYDRGLTVGDGKNSDGFNTYEVDWTSESLKWIINGNTVRTLTPATADFNQYPQSPMQFKIGNWAAGDSDSKGTSDWAGGKVQWSQGPFDMIIKSVEITDYSTGTGYSYGDKTGNWQSIKSNGGKINAMGSVPSEISTASASGTTLTNKPTVSAATQAQTSATTTANAAAQTGSGTAIASGSGVSQGAGSASGNFSGSGSQPTGTTTSGSAAATGAAAIAKPIAGLLGAGLLAVLVL